MLQSMLELFTTTEKVEAMLTSPIIEMIFMALLWLFAIAVAIHLLLFFKIRKTRNYVKETGRLDVEPLHSIKKEFDVRQSDEGMKIETFIQEKFSSWRMAQVPVISLIKLIQMTISVFILLGVLGTFIGLTISLGSIQLQSDQLMENVAGVLSGIDVAFYTSIIGMSFSLVMTVLVRVLNTEYLLTDLMLIVESQLEGVEKQGMNRMIEVSEGIQTAIKSLEENNQYALNSIVESFAGFKDYTEGLQQSAEDLASFNEGLSTNLQDFQALFQQMTMITDGFSKGTTQLNDNFSTLFSYFKEVDRKNERIAETFEQTHTTIQDVAETQKKSMQVFDESMLDMKDFTSASLDRQASAQKELEAFNREAQKLVETMAAHNTTFKGVFGEALSSKLEGISTYLAALKYEFDKVGDAFGSLPEALEIVKETQREHALLLGDRFRELKEFNQTFHQHLKNQVTGVSKFENQLRETTTTFEQIASKNSEFLNEMGRVVKEIQQNVTQREREVHSNVNTLKDTLATHVSSVENTLSQKLETVIRNMDQGLYTVTDGMNRELIEMRRMAEELNQNHVRLVQQSLQELGREMQHVNRQITQSGQQPIRQANRIGLNHDEF